MKKLILVVLLVILAMSVLSISYAEEDFKLRNGILFGDTIETIMEKENTLTRQGEDSNWFDGKIAGYNNESCGFYFDDDGKLVSMDYSFTKNCTSRESMNDVYSKLYQSLNRQYGKPKGNTGGTTYIITGPAIDRMALSVYLLGSLDGYKGDYLDYDEWVIECSGYSVKIDLISYYYRNEDYDYTYCVDLSYHKFTDADLDAAINEKREEQNEVDSDL